MQRPRQKKKRSANFSEEEKLRFLRLIKEKGNVIIQKVSMNDSQSNKQKENAWKIVCRDLNSRGSVMRNIDTLKKLWQKLKSEAKTFKSVAAHHGRGTGDGPSKKVNNPVFEMILEMTEHGSTGKSEVSVCDSDHLPVEEISEDRDECKTPLIAPQSPLPPAAAAQKPAYNTIYLLDDNGSQMVEELIEHPSPYVPAAVKRKIPNTKYRTPQGHVCNVRSGLTRAQTYNYSNSFATEKLRSKRAKLELTRLKIEHENEFQHLRIEKERRLYSLKEQILEKLLQRIGDGGRLDPDMIQVALSATGESPRE